MDDKERCPSCNESYQKASKQQIVDVCGHGRCYSCLSVGGFCPLCQALLTDKVKGSSEVNSAIQATNAGSTSQVNEDAMSDNVVESHGSDGRHVACGSRLTEKETLTAASEQQTSTNCRDVAVKSAPGVSVHQHEMSHAEMQHASISSKEGATHEQHGCLPEVKRSGDTELTNSVEGAAHEQHGSLPLEESGSGTEHISPVEGDSHKVSGPCSEVKISATIEKGKSGEKTPRECKVEVNVIRDCGPDSFPPLDRNKVNQKNDKSKDSVKVISNETPITQDGKCTSDSEGGEEEDGLVQAETTGEVLVKKMKNGKKRRRKSAWKSSNASNSEKRQTSVKSDGVNNPGIVAADEQETKQESRKERDARKKANAREKAGNVTENQPLLRKRRMRKSDGEFSCDKCGRTFNRKCHFTSHLKTHTRHNLQCHRCLTVCSDNVEYVKHGEECKLKTRTKRKLLRDCEICGKMLTSAEGMALHLNAHKKESRHICRFCGKGISTKQMLIVHERIHTGERPFSCEQCGNSFREKGALTVHMRIHTGEKPFTCEYCRKSFRFKNVLRRHERLHTGKKEFQCEVCGLFFQHSKSLQIHKMKHTGERPFPCETCEKAFKTSYDLKIHMMTHIIGEKPHRCNICEKGFQHPSSLMKHRKIKHDNPEGILCDMCGKIFAYNWQLLKHFEKTHSPKIPKRERKPYIRNPNPSKEFPCAVCSKRFSAKRTLLRHMHVHASNPKYQCKFCGRTFAGKWNVKKHIENKHSTPISFDSQQEV